MISGGQRIGVGGGAVVSTPAPFRVLTTHHLEKITEEIVNRRKVKPRTKLFDKEISVFPTTENE